MEAVRRPAPLGGRGSPLGEAKGPPPFDLVYDQGFAFVWRTLRRLGIPAQDCEDAAHEVFVVVLRRLHAYEPRDRLTGWLGAICDNVARKWRMRGVREVPVEHDASESLSESAPSLEQRVVAGDLVHHLLDALSEAARIVFVLHELEELTVPEIARALGRPEKTVYDQLARARAELLNAAGRLNAREDRRLTLAAFVTSARMAPLVLPGAQDRVWARLQLDPAFPSGTAAPTGGTPGTSMLTKMSALGPFALGAVLGVGVGAVWDPLHWSPPASVVATREAAASPVVSAPPASASSSATAAPIASSSATVAPIASSSAKPGGSLTEERALLDKAAAFLVAGNTGAAIGVCQDHATRFRRPLLAEERDATWILALLKAGRVAEARTRVERFARSYPNNAQLDDFKRAVGLSTEQP